MEGLFRDLAEKAFTKSVALVEVGGVNLRPVTLSNEVGSWTQGSWHQKSEYHIPSVIE